MQERISLTALARSNQTRALAWLLAALLALGGPMRAAANETTQWFPNSFPPPPFLNLDFPGNDLFFATQAQKDSLRALEDRAVRNVITLQSLTAGDTAAVQTWGRTEALAKLYGILMNAIKESASDRTVDEQNAVDWLTTVAHRRVIDAAHNAGREYVKWAGLDQYAFEHAEQKPQPE